MQLDDIYGLYYLASGDYNKAIEHIKRVLAYYEDVHNEKAILLTKKDLALIYFEKGDYKTAAETYFQIIQKSDSLNIERFAAQINEFRTVYELDKADMEIQKRMAENKIQKMVIMELVFLCIGLTVIVLLVIWSRKKITEKNRGLYRQIKEQDRLSAELKYFETQTQDINKNTDSEMQERQIVERLTKYLLSNQNYANPDIDAVELATCIGTNRTSLFKAVKTVTGKTPQEYINFLRLDEAKRLLEDTNELIDTIAALCGFNTLRTFYRLFKERYNISPLVYRKMRGEIKE